MSNELVKSTGTSLTEKADWARLMATATLLPRQYQNNPGNLLYAVEYADALGIDRINAITSIHVIQGKPSASADLIAGLIRKAGHRLRIEGDDTFAKATLIRKDDPEFEYVAHWNMQKARTAGLTTDTWKKYPAAMLRSRAITEVARMGASDALYGVVYTPEELGAAVNEEGTPTTDVTVSASSGHDRLRQAAAPEADTPKLSPQNVAEAGYQIPHTQLDDAEDDTEDSDVVDAEIVNDEPASPAKSEPMITKAQTTALHAAITDLGLDRDQKLAGIATVIGRQVDSTKELTKKEASEVIDRLVAKLGVTEHTS